MFNLDLSGIIGPILGALAAIAGVFGVFHAGKSSGRSEVIGETDKQTLKTESAMLKAVADAPTTKAAVIDALSDPKREI